jgi:hypothetical protein
VQVYRKAVDLLVEAESLDDARQGFEELVGAEILCDEHRVFFESAQSRKGEAIDPASFEGEGLPLFPGRATMAVLTDSIDTAEAVFARLKAEELEIDGRVVALEGVEPAKSGTMPTPSEYAAPTPISILHSARAFIGDHGGSVYLWSSDGQLAVAASPPAGVEFEFHDDDEGVRVFTEVGFVHLPLPVVIFLERVPRKRLAATSSGTFAGAP